MKKEIKKTKAKKLEKKYRDHKVDITLTLDEVINIMDALCEFKPRENKWYKIYRDLAFILDDQCDEVDQEEKGL